MPANIKFEFFKILIIEIEYLKSLEGGGTYISEQEHEVAAAQEKERQSQRFNNC